MRALTILLASMALLAVAVGRRPQPDFLTDLRNADGVARVEKLVSVPRPGCRIIHIADYHSVALEDLAADLRDQDTDVSEGDIEAEHRRIMATVRLVQKNQLRFIRWLAKRHDVRIVHLEGLTDSYAKIYPAMIRLVKEGTLESFRVGAAGQALIAGDIQAVAPAEDDATFDASDPYAGKPFTIDLPIQDARDAAIVRRLSSAGPLAAVVLGVGHDLSRHVRALGSCDYLKVYVDGLPPE